MSEYNGIAEHYDRTRGGERRGDEYAADLDRYLPAGDGPILEVGVGTGVVALGLVRRGRTVIGLDVSAPMLARAHERLGPVVVRTDAMNMAVATASVAHAVSVWVIHSVADPVRHFREAARVLRPGGLYLACLAQRPAAGDAIGRIIAQMGAAVDGRRSAARPRGVTVAETLSWAANAGFEGTVRRFSREWIETPADQLEAIERRTWPAMRELDEASIVAATTPAIAALRALPQVEHRRHAEVEMVALRLRAGD
jgi:ubiquinone/menaquinone biosynthesis C-methylase UbiE